MIHVGAAADPIPDALLEQLDMGGVMVIPVGPDGGNQYIMKITREPHGFRKETLIGVRYVPLTDK